MIFSSNLFVMLKWSQIAHLCQVMFDNLAKSPDCHNVISTIGRNLNSIQWLRRKISRCRSMTGFFDFLRDHNFYSGENVQALLSCHFSIRRPDLIIHGPVAALAFIPHSGELRLVVFDVIEDADILLVSMISVQAARILLKGSFP